MSEVQKPPTEAADTQLTTTNQETPQQGKPGFFAAALKRAADTIGIRLHKPPYLDRHKTGVDSHRPYFTVNRENLPKATNPQEDPSQA